jgi:hypothetical protein
MFTVLRVRDAAEDVEKDAWYVHPPGTVAERATAEELARDGIEPAGDAAEPAAPAPAPEPAPHHGHGHGHGH